MLLITSSRASSIMVETNLNGRFVASYIVGTITSNVVDVSCTSSIMAEKMVNLSWFLTFYVNLASCGGGGISCILLKFVLSLITSYWTSSIME